MRLSIKAKLIGGFLIVVALLLAVFGIAYNGINNMKSAENDMEKRYTDAMLLQEGQYFMIQQYQWMADRFINDDPAAEQGFEESNANMEAAWQAGFAEADTPEELAMVDQIWGYDEEFDKLFFEEFVPAVEAGASMEVIREIDGRADEALAGAIGLNTQMIESYTAEAHEALAAAESAASAAITMTIAMSLIAAVIAVGLGFFLSQAISKGVGSMLTAAEAMAEGDIDQTVEVKSKDEIGDMANAFTRLIEYVKGMAGAAEKIADGDLTVEVTPKSEKDVLGNAFSKMLVNLRDVIGQAKDASDSLGEASVQLSSASEQAGQATQGIASTSQQVAKGAEEQSTSI